MNANNIWDVYSCLSPYEWRIDSTKQSLRVVNLYSDEEFNLVRTRPPSSKVLESFKNRSIYPIPYTPKVIMPKFQIDSSVV